MGQSCTHSRMVCLNEAIYASPLEANGVKLRISKCEFRSQKQPSNHFAKHGRFWQHVQKQQLPHVRPDKLTRNEFTSQIGHCGLLVNDSLLFICDASLKCFVGYAQKSIFFDTKLHALMCSRGCSFCSRFPIQESRTRQGATNKEQR